MPRYFFDIADTSQTRRTTARDEAGVDLNDEGAARAHALMVLGGYVLPEGSASSSTSVTCRDQKGATVFTLSFEEGDRP